MPPLLGSDLNGAVPSIALELRWLVRNEIAPANDLLQILKASAQPSHRARNKRCAAGQFRQISQGVGTNDFVLLLVKFLFRANRVDRNFAPLGARNRLFQSGFAGIIFAVADHHKNAGNRL